MKDNIFIDSNILLYAHTDLDIDKQAKAQELLLSDKIFISTQVLNEFINASRKKFKKEWHEIQEVLKEIVQYSYYDSLIITLALTCNCSILYSEDLQDGQVIEKKLKIINPFKNVKTLT